ncbi:hypothetical protein FQA39_LY11151 [Lamprigera yunnana]|nr:hypothetical protein FQA39_LY11151 [Lamprigera yunnana]
MNKRDHSGSIPNRWLNCPRKAEGLIVEKFLAFKTPLNEKYDDKVPPKCRFPPSMILDYCKLKKIKLTLWIDLTNTTRFYDKNEIEHNCKYLKLKCRGHGETPSRKQTKEFIRTVSPYVFNGAAGCIGVHCTHGFNRTGFLIVSYLIEEMDYSLEKALESFAIVRPPGIYKPDYLEELYRRYDNISNAPPAPPLPDWCYEEQNESDEGESFNSELNSYQGSSQDSDYSPPMKMKKFDKPTKVPVFMKGVSGVTPFNDQPKARELQKKIVKFCEYNKNINFPGAQPVSMDQANIKLLGEKPYSVSWKADGTRYLMLIENEEEVYFFDRDNCVFIVKGLKFPHRKELRHLRDTLVDGEMVIDKVNGINIPRFLIYDIIKFEKQNVGKLQFYQRLHCIENEIIKPRIRAMESGYINKSTEPFSIRKKEFWHITQAGSLLSEKFAKTLSHEPDGLIFQPVTEPYRAGPCDDILKWKPLELNSVDFRLKIVHEGGLGIIPKKIGELYVGQLDKPFATIKFSKELRDLDNKIVECKYENTHWKFMRERTDKSYPNAYSTAIAVYRSILKPVTKEYLLSYIDKEVMPPPSHHPRKC